MTRWLAAVVAFGCSGAPASAPPAAAASQAPQPDERPAIERVRGIASGAIALADAVDPARGVVFADYFVDVSEQDPRAAADGLVKAATRVCGDQLAARFAQLRSDLSRHAGDLSCQQTVCSYDAVSEYDLGATIQFGTGGVLDSVVLIEGGPVTDEFTREGREWASAELARLAKGSCP